MALSALILVYHCSRDCRARDGFEQLLNDCRRALAPQPVAGAQLEFGDRPLAEQLTGEVARISPEIDTLTVVPIFMGNGTHVRDDIPAALATFKEQHPHITLRSTPPLGQSPALAVVLEQHLRHHSALDRWIVWFHGSRLPQFGAEAEQVCQELQQRQPRCHIATAYWAQTPSLATQVDNCYQRGIRQLGVLPAFFFAGGLVDRLRVEVQQLQQQYAGLDMAIADLLMPHPLWVEAIRHWANVAAIPFASAQPVA
jgi:sirohydrochlorin cobaltochelatase